MSVCSECHGGCCRRYYIDLTGYDIVNISKNLELDPFMFISTQIVEDDEVEKLSEDAALFKFINDKCKNFRRIILKRIESKIIPETTRCMFLQEWDNKEIPTINENQIVSRCGIYGLRPLVCSIYPVKLDESQVFGYVPDPYYNCEKKKTPAYNLCPRPLNSEDFADYSGEITKNLAMHKFEMDFFKSVATIWNDNPGSIDEFFKHIASIYQNRVVFEQREEAP
ncbi:MAG: YkgJ family cysteine cluster protein [Candidatus Gastranaerophilales bacterium]|nr:YkgJ family cysteine cluster protein [Candidatus Gastranaerophilales bacterium]